MRLPSPSIRLLVAAAIYAAGLSVAPGTQAADAVVGPADRAAIHEVVQGQLEAFQHDDGSKAFSYAAPMIREMFQTPDIFMDMVKSGYAPVYRPKQVEFGGIETIDGSPVQHVFLIGPDGANIDALYYMEHETDGTWRIKGCELRQSNSA